MQDVSTGGNGKGTCDRILIETDAPVQYGDRFSEPADLHETLFHLSRIKKIPEDKLARIVTKNAEKFFGL